MDTVNTADAFRVDGADRDLSGVAMGSVIGGRYRVGKILGTGGMGTVFEGRHLDLEQMVAIKVLRADRASSKEHVARFAREARAAASIESEHIVRVLDVGTLDGGAPFMVLEHLRGADLARILKKRGPLPVEEAVSYVLTTCEALAVAHAKGIVHRDLKPSNLFLAERGDGSTVLKVLDFGVSKFLTRESAEHGVDADGDFLTNTSSVVGSPQYIAPEQIRDSRTVDTRVDIWALGVVLFRLLTQKYPFVGSTPADLYASILVNPAASLRSARKDLPEELELVIKKCLEKKPSDRYADIGELAKALAPFAPRAGDAVSRIATIIAGRGGAEPVPFDEVDGEMDLSTIDLMLDAPVVAPDHDEYLTTSAGVATATEPRRREARSSFPILVAAFGVVFVFGAAAVAYALLPSSKPPASVSAASQSSTTSPTSEDARSAASSAPDNRAPAASEPPEPPAAPVAPAAPPPRAAGTKPKSPPTTVKPGATPTPKPALSDIPSYGGRK